MFVLHSLATHKQDFGTQAMEDTPSYLLVLLDFHLLIYASPPSTDCSLPSSLKPTILSIIKKIPADPGTSQEDNPQLRLSLPNGVKLTTKINHHAILFSYVFSSAKVGCHLVVESHQ